MKPRWAFVLLWPMTVAFLAVVTLNDRGWRVQWTAALVVYLGLVVVLLLFVAARAHSAGRRLQLRSPRRTSRIPEAVTETLPKAVWVLRNREPARLERILLDGPLLDEANIAYTALLAVGFAAELIHAASGDNPDEHDRAELLAEAEYAVELLPVVVATEQLGAWLDQLTGGEVTHRFDRPHDLDLATLGSLLTLSAAAAVKAGLTRAQIYSYYQAVEDSFEHGHKLPSGWAPRASDAT